MLYAVQDWFRRPKHSGRTLRRWNFGSLYTLNLRDSRVYDTIVEDGKEKRVLNQNETTLAQQKQQAIKDAFAGWVWKDPQRRTLLVKRYNELFNSTRPREYDGSHIHFVGICFVLFFGATAITEDIGRFSEWLAEL